MRRYTRIEKKHYLEIFHQSSCTQRDFCKQQGLAPTTFHKWLCDSRLGIIEKLTCNDNLSTQEKSNNNLTFIPLQIKQDECDMQPRRSFPSLDSTLSKATSTIDLAFQTNHFRLSVSLDISTAWGIEALRTLIHTLHTVSS